MCVRYSVYINVHPLQYDIQTCPASIAHIPITNNMLNTADPTMVPTPTSPLATNTPKRRTRKDLRWVIFNDKHHYYPYRAFGGQNKIVYSTRFVRRAIFFKYCPGNIFFNIARTLCDQSFNRESRYAPPTLVTVATSHKLSLSCDDKMAAGSHPRSLDSKMTHKALYE